MHTRVCKEDKRNARHQKVIDDFVKTKKNALHPLLCQGGFGDTALKIVDGHYLIRSFHDVLKQQDPFTKWNTFIDVFISLSGSQGIGILPDVLDIKENQYAKALSDYANHFDTLETQTKKLTIDYRLSESLERSIQESPLKPFLNDQVKESLSQTEQMVQGFLKNEEQKVFLLFCHNTSDTILSSLFVSNLLLSLGEKKRVLSIDCGDYPGKASSDCIRLSLQKMKLKPTHLECIQEDPILILLRGYENIGTYDNLYVKNKLSNWKSVKMIDL